MQLQACRQPAGHKGDQLPLIPDELCQIACCLRGAACKGGWRRAYCTTEHQERNHNEAAPTLTSQTRALWPDCKEGSLQRTASTHLAMMAALAGPHVGHGATPAGHLSLHLAGRQPCWVSLVWRPPTDQHQALPDPPRDCTGPHISCTSPCKTHVSCMSLRMTGGPGILCTPSRKDGNPSTGQAARQRHVVEHSAYRGKPDTCTQQKCVAGHATDSRACGDSDCWPSRGYICLATLNGMR